MRVVAGRLYFLLCLCFCEFANQKHLPSAQYAYSSGEVRDFVRVRVRIRIFVLFSGVAIVKG